MEISWAVEREDLTWALISIFRAAVAPSTLATYVWGGGERKGGSLRRRRRSGFIAFSVFVRKFSWRKISLLSCGLRVQSDGRVIRRDWYACENRKAAARAKQVEHHNKPRREEMKKVVVWAARERSELEDVRIGAYVALTFTALLRCS